MPAQRTKKHPDLSRRARILDVAVEEFASEGFAGVRIDRIAARAESNKQLIYYYFGDKAGLYEAVLAKMVDAMADHWRELDGLHFTAAVLAMLERAAAPENAVWERLLAREGLEDAVSGETEAHLEQQRRSAWRHQVEVIELAQRRGELNPGFEPDMVALALAMTTIAPRLLPQLTRMITGERPTDPDFTRRYRRFHEQLAAAMSAPPPAPEPT